MSRRNEITTLKVGSTIFSTALASLLEETPIWPNVGLGACKIIVRGRLHAAEGLASRRRGESGRNDFVAGMLADVSEVVLPPRVMNCEALRPPAIF
jgi:hypothetical protein